MTGYAWQPLEQARENGLLEKYDWFWGYDSGFLSIIPSLTLEEMTHGKPSYIKPIDTPSPPNLELMEVKGG